MKYFRVVDNQIEEVKAGDQILDDDLTKYPQHILHYWTDQELQKLSIYRVEEPIIPVGKILAEPIVYMLNPFRMPVADYTLIDAPGEFVEYHPDPVIEHIFEIQIPANNIPEIFPPAPPAPPNPTKEIITDQAVERQAWKILEQNEIEPTDDMMEKVKRAIYKIDTSEFIIGDLQNVEFSKQAISTMD